MKLDEMPPLLEPLERHEFVVSAKSDYYCDVCGKQRCRHESYPFTPEPDPQMTWQYARHPYFTRAGGWASHEIALLAATIIILLGIVVALWSKKPDSETDKLERMIAILKLQTAAAFSCTDALKLEMDCAYAGDTNGEMFWHSNVVVFEAIEHEAYLKLREQ